MRFPKLRVPWERPQVTPVLPDDVLERAAEVKAERPPYRLVYGSDLKTGMILLVEKQCENPLAEIFGGHDHGVEPRRILEVREAPQGARSCITVGEDGEQHPFIVHEAQSVPVVEEFEIPDGVPANLT